MPTSCTADVIRDSLCASPDSPQRDINTARDATEGSVAMSGAVRGGESADTDRNGMVLDGPYASHREEAAPGSRSPLRH